MAEGMLAEPTVPFFRYSDCFEGLVGLVAIGFGDEIRKVPGIRRASEQKTDIFMKGNRDRYFFLCGDLGNTGYFIQRYYFTGTEPADIDGPHPGIVKDLEIIGVF